MLAASLQTAAATLWLTPDCSTADSPFQCRLLTWLSMLEATAGVLAFLLILAALFAVIAFRRAKVRKTVARKTVVRKLDKDRRP